MNLDVELQDAPNTEIQKLQTAWGHDECQTHLTGALHSSQSKNSWSRWPATMTSAEDISQTSRPFIRIRPGQPHLSPISGSILSFYMHTQAQTHVHTAPKCFRKNKTKKNRLNHTHTCTTHLHTHKYTVRGDSQPVQSGHMLTEAWMRKLLERCVHHGSEGRRRTLHYTTEIKIQC